MPKVRYILILSIIMVVFFALLFIFYENYQNTINIINSEYATKQKLVEESIYNTLKYADSFSQIVEELINEEMTGYSLFMVDKYRQDPHVLNWDLEELKNQFGDFEIYIIAQDLKVVRTTFKKDLGLNFKIFPSFSSLLNKRLQGNSFIADRLDISTNTGKLMKYSYMPTPDHKYLLQLSIEINKRFPAMRNMDTFSMANTLISQHPSVRDISIYKHNPSGIGILKISKNKPFYTVVHNETKLKNIQKAMDTNQIQISVVEDELTGNYYTQKYIPYVDYQSDGKYGWWNSHVIKIEYNDGIFQRKLKKERAFFEKSIFTVSIIYFILGFITIYLIYKSEHMAYHDHLTGLPNRKLFEEHFDKRILDTKRGKKLAVLFLDLDNFKIVNDTYGHNIGDKLLQEVAEDLQKALRKNDFISRLGGDEFSILLSDIKTTNDAIIVAEKINALFADPITIDEHILYAKPSIGISLYPDHGGSPEKLIQRADMAMYQAKKRDLCYMVYVYNNN